MSISRITLELRTLTSMKRKCLLRKGLKWVPKIVMDCSAAISAITSTIGTSVTSI